MTDPLFEQPLPSAHPRDAEPSHPGTDHLCGDHFASAIASLENASIAGEEDPGAALDSTPHAQPGLVVEQTRGRSEG